MVTSNQQLRDEISDEKPVVVVDFVDNNLTEPQIGCCQEPSSKPESEQETKQPDSSNDQTLSNYLLYSRQTTSFTSSVDSSDIINSKNSSPAQNEDKFSLLSELENEIDSGDEFEKDEFSGSWSKNRLQK